MPWKHAFDGGAIEGGKLHGLDRCVGFWRPKGAAEGTLTVMAGGQEVEIERISG
jgi:3-hydroxyisobutyrate dehydrogenase-like beta-hydroxyacid dehydrogenase